MDEPVWDDTLEPEVVRFLDRRHVPVVDELDPEQATAMTQRSPVLESVYQRRRGIENIVYQFDLVSPMIVFHDNSGALREGAMVLAPHVSPEGTSETV